MRLSWLILTFFFLELANIQAKNIHFITINNVDVWEDLVILCRQKEIPLFVTYTNEAKMPQSINAFQNTSKHVKYVNNNFVSVYVNSYSQLGQALKTLFVLDETTWFLIVNPQEELLLKRKKINQSFFEEGSSRFKDFEALMLKHYNRQLNKDEWLVYLDIKHNNFGYLGTVSEANNFLPQVQESDLSDPNYWPFITKLCIDLNNPILKTIRSNKSLVETDKKKFPWLDYYINAYNLNLSFAIDHKDSLRLSRMKDELIPLYPDSSKREYQKLLVEQQYLGALNKWNSYKRITFAYLNNESTPEAFYTEFEKLFYGYTFNKVSDLLEEILEAGIEVKSTFKLNYNMAELLIAKGENDRAWLYANAAAEKASNSKEQSQAAVLRQYLMY